MIEPIVENDPHVPPTVPADDALDAQSLAVLVVVALIATAGTVPLLQVLRLTAGDCEKATSSQASGRRIFCPVWQLT